MAFLVDDDSYDHVQNLWPSEFKRLTDAPTYYADCTFWQAVPCTDVELSEWLQIIPNPISGDRSRPYAVTHIPDAEDGNEDGAELYELAVRFTGFLERFNLGTLGNWNGTESGAVKAIQSIVLSGGGYEAPWKATLRALNRLMTVVAKIAKPEHEHQAPFGDMTDGNVFMQRRVFTKANTESVFNVPSDVAHRGPELHAIGKSWHLDDRMEFGQLSRDGALKHATNVIFRQGHFVEVTAHVEIVSNKNGAIRVQLRPERVVLISTEGQTKGRQTAANAVKVLKRRAPLTTTEDVEDTQPGASKHETRAGGQGHNVEDEDAMKE